MPDISNLYALGEHVPSLPEDGDYWIAPDARVIGQVSLGKGASVWFGSILRADNDVMVIGAGTNLQEHVMCHVDPGFPLHVGENCTVGHKAMLHGCTIGDGSLIGMSSTILNGAVIGKGCIIGAGAVVTEGMVIPDNSLVVGMPAKIKRELSAEQAGMGAKLAEKYRWNKDQFKAKLKPL